MKHGGGLVLLKLDLAKVRSDKKVEFYLDKKE